MTFTVITGLFGLLIWLSILCLPWRPWSTRESLDASQFSPTFDLSQLTVIIPARDEAEHIAQTLTNVIEQGKGHRIIVVDDESSDATASIAARFSEQGVEVLPGKASHDGWYGKLWALEQGRQKVSSDYTLLLDADISLQQGTLQSLLQHQQKNQLDMVSLMAFLRMETLWEKLLMPAFIYFFKLLYPFHLSNQQSRWVAAAAGGCILLKTEALNSIGGFTRIRNTLIDDCTLAKTLRNNGKRTWVGLTHSAISLRPYRDLDSIWLMVTRTAFTQLQHSLVLLILCTILMYCAFISPLLLLFSSQFLTVAMAVLTLMLMVISFIPTLNYYSLNQLWAFTLPVAGFLYLGMTLDSARKYYFSSGASWKGRDYGKT